RGPADRARRLDQRYKRSVSGLACLALIVSPLFGGGPRLPRTVRWVLGATALRLVCLGLGPPLPAPGSKVLDPDVFASTLLGPLLTSPLDLWLTSAWAALVAAVFAAHVLRRQPPRPSVPRTVLCRLLSIAVIGATFALIADVSANSSLDLEAIALFPKSAAHLVLQTALLLELFAGACVLVGVLGLAGPFPESRGPAA